MFSLSRFFTKLGPEWVRCYLESKLPDRLPAFDSLIETEQETEIYWADELAKALQTESSHLKVWVRIHSLDSSANRSAFLSLCPHAPKELAPLQLFLWAALNEPELFDEYFWTSQCEHKTSWNVFRSEHSLNPKDSWKIGDLTQAVKEGLTHFDCGPFTDCHVHTHQGKQMLAIVYAGPPERQERLDGGQSQTVLTRLVEQCFVIVGEREIWVKSDCRKQAFIRMIRNTVCQVLLKHPEQIQQELVKRPINLESLRSLTLEAPDPHSIISQVVLRYIKVEIAYPSGDIGVREFGLKRHGSIVNTLTDEEKALIQQKNVSITNADIQFHFKSGHPQQVPLSARGQVGTDQTERGEAIEDYLRNVGIL